MDKELVYLKKLSVHNMSVQSDMSILTRDMNQRSKRHDMSKRTGMEKDVFQENIHIYPNVWGLGKEVSSMKQNETLQAALKSHSENNDYMPNHFMYGVYEMTLPQLSEMICSLTTSAKEEGLSMEELEKFIDEELWTRYKIDDPLRSILINTAKLIMNA